MADPVWLRVHHFHRSLLPSLHVFYLLNEFQRVQHLCIVRLEREELVHVREDVILAEVAVLVVHHEVRVRSFALELNELLEDDVIVLLQCELALLYQRRGEAFALLDVKDEELENVLERLYQVLEVVPEFVYEEWFYYLVVEQYALRQSLLGLAESSVVL